uniref:hypothetical protein n=1 Tax=Piscinibacter terrae TaxID=2496871 RepID=UPI0038B3E8E0
MRWRSRWRWTVRCPPRGPRHSAPRRASCGGASTPRPARACHRHRISNGCPASSRRRGWSCTRSRARRSRVS